MDNKALGDARTSDSAVGRAWTVLVVEDEQTVRTVARRILERAGHRVIEAESGEQAIRLAGAADSAIDVVVSDVVMPGMSGPNAVKEIRVQHPNVAVLYTSGYPDLEMRKHGLEHEPLLLKPYRRIELLARVERVVEQGLGL